MSRRLVEFGTVRPARAGSRTWRCSTWGPPSSSSPGSTRVDPRRRRSETNRQACLVRRARLMRVTRPGVASGGFVPLRHSVPSRPRAARTPEAGEVPRQTRPAARRASARSATKTSTAPPRPPDRRLAVSGHLRGRCDHREPAQRRPNHASPRGAQRRAPDCGWDPRPKRPGTPDRHVTPRYQGAQRPDLEARAPGPLRVRS
jgi:hypothetical protein